MSEQSGSPAAAAAVNAWCVRAFAVGLRTSPRLNAPPPPPPWLGPSVCAAAAAARLFCRLAVLPMLTESQCRPAHARTDVAVRHPPPRALPRCHHYERPPTGSAQNKQLYESTVFSTVGAVAVGQTVSRAYRLAHAIFSEDFFLLAGPSPPCRRHIAARPHAPASAAANPARPQYTRRPRILAGSMTPSARPAARASPRRALAAALALPRLRSAACLLIVLALSLALPAGAQSVDASVQDDCTCSCCKEVRAAVLPIPLLCRPPAPRHPAAPPSCYFFPASKKTGWIGHLRRTETGLIGKESQLPGSLCCPQSSSLLLPPPFPPIQPWTPLSHSHPAYGACTHSLR